VGFCCDFMKSNFVYFWAHSFQNVFLWFHLFYWNYLFYYSCPLLWYWILRYQDICMFVLAQ
jgi:hypothetical protein